MELKKNKFVEHSSKSYEFRNMNFLLSLFRFPFLRLPKITDNTSYDLNNISCGKCQSMLKIIAEKYD